MVHTDFRGEVIRDIQLPVAARYSSGGLAVSPTGDVAVLRRALKGPSQVFLCSSTGNITEQATPNEDVVMEIVFSNNNLFGASWSKWYSLSKTEAKTIANFVPRVELSVFAASSALESDSCY